MKTYESLYTKLDTLGLTDWRQQLQQFIPDVMAAEGHGNMNEWQLALATLPHREPSIVELKDNVIIGTADDLSKIEKEKFIQALKTFHPWRKGPFRLFDIEIDTEWRSDWKWDRLLPHIQPLSGRKVLDIGCGNGYHGWRMLGEGAELVIGIDPTLIFVMQYLLMQRYINSSACFVLPLGIEDLPKKLACFDTVFSMGVLYHRRSPLDHLYELRDCLRPGGELVLETLVIEGRDGQVLLPKGRYAKMRNVWFLPSIQTMISWLDRCGFTDVSCVDSNQTSTEEQRTTDWMTFESLTDFLDPDDQQKTIEGYPAPLRAIFTAKAP